MATSARLANIAANAAADAACALLNGGTLKIYDGVQPATADTAVTSQNVLAQLTFGSPAFGASSAGVATANAIASDSDADASGTATWFRACKSDGSAVFDGSVGVAGCDLNLNTTAILIHATVACSSFTYTQSET